ncbi:MAG: hypothetical protein FWD73_14370 [Polyangiaceae bacterium]|nr:hypothetical protein [Polyangiaceae bacterium]
MSEPTIQDVVELIQQLRTEMATKGELQALRSEMATKGELSALRSEMATLRSEMATKDGLRAVEVKVDTLDTKVTTLAAKLDAHRAETAKGFAELDRELAGHADPIHRRIEEEIASIKKQLAATRPAARRAQRRA